MRRDTPGGWTEHARRVWTPGYADLQAANQTPEGHGPTGSDPSVACPHDIQVSVGAATLGLWSNWCWTSQLHNHRDRSPIDRQFQHAREKPADR
jgi:hypothetical protein